jgi:hypothetical protein
LHGAETTDDRLCADALKSAVPNLPDEHKRMLKELFGFLHKGTLLICLDVSNYHHHHH